MSSRRPFPEIRLVCGPKTARQKWVDYFTLVTMSKPAALLGTIGGGVESNVGWQIVCVLRASSTIVEPYT